MALASLERGNSIKVNNVNYQDLTLEEVERETVRNAATAAQAVMDFDEDHFSRAMGKLEVLAVNYSYPLASYALGKLTWDRMRFDCELLGNCDWTMTKKMEVHFEIAARSDQTGGAAFSYAHVIGRIQGDGWRENSKTWSRLGKSKKLALLEKEYQGRL